MMVELFEVLLFTLGIAATGEGEIPVAPDADAPRFRHQEMRRRQLPDRLIDGLWRRHVLKRQIRVQRVRTPFLRNLRILEQRLDLGAEDDARRQQRVEQGFDAEAIANQQQTAARRVPQREREHSAEARHRQLAPLLVGVDDDFSVGVRAKTMTTGLEFDSQLGKVIDLAVEDRPNRLVFVRQRLIPCREIDDAQAAMPQADAVAAIEAAGVRTSMRDDRHHRDQLVLIDAMLRVEVEASDDATHISPGQDASTVWLSAEIMPRRASSER